MWRGAVAVNNFVRRQTENSPFSHFDGLFEAVATKAAAVLQQAARGDADALDHIYKQKADGVFMVKVNPLGFYSAVVQVRDDTPLIATFEARTPGEAKHIVVRARAKKSPARFVDLIVYRRDILSEMDRSPPVTTDKDGPVFAQYELISINCSIALTEPEHPLAMARNFLGMPGGTVREYTAADFATAIWYWSQHTMASPPLAETIVNTPRCPQCGKNDQVKRSPDAYACARCGTVFIP